MTPPERTTRYTAEDQLREIADTIERLGNDHFHWSDVECLRKTAALTRAVDGFRAWLTDEGSRNDWWRETYGDVLTELDRRLGRLGGGE